MAFSVTQKPYQILTTKECPSFINMTPLVILALFSICLFSSLPPPPPPFHSSLPPLHFLHYLFLVLPVLSPSFHSQLYALSLPHFFSSFSPPVPPSIFLSLFLFTQLIPLFYSSIPLFPPPSPLPYSFEGT